MMSYFCTCHVAEALVSACEYEASAKHKTDVKINTVTAKYFIFYQMYPESRRRKRPLADKVPGKFRGQFDFTVFEIVLCRAVLDVKYINIILLQIDENNIVV